MTKYKDNNTYGQNNTNYAPPAGIVGPEAVKEMQRWLGGLTVDGIWGPKTQKQFDKAMAAVLKTTEVPPAPADRERLSYAEDLYKLSLGIGKSGLGNYMARGYDPPGSIKSAEDVRAFQESHGLDVDGIWAGRTQRKHDQIQQQWAGQYDPDEITRLAMEGLHKLAGAGESAFLEGTIPLSGGSAKAGQAAGTQIDIKPAKTSSTTMPNRAAKGYTIPTGVGNVAAMQHVLGVGVDGLWGEETDRAYKKLVSGGRNVPNSTQELAAQLKQMYQDVMASKLSMGEKAEAIALLAALEKYGNPEHNRKALLGIQMAGGAGTFFKKPSEPTLTALVISQIMLREDLENQLVQKEDERKSHTIPDTQYRELQRQEAELKERIFIAETRLDRLFPSWKEAQILPDWRAVDDWEQAQLAEAAKAEQESGKVEPEKVEEEGAPEAGENTAKPRFTYEPLENKNRALNDSEVKAFVGTIIGEIGKEASEQYKKGEELTTAKAVAFVIMNCLRYQKGGYQQYNTVETVAKRYFDAFEGNGMASFTAYLEGDYTKLAKLQNNTSEKYVKTRVVPLYEAIMQAVLPILDGIDNEDFTNGARHIFSPERQKNGGRDIPDWVFSDNEVIVDSLKGYDLKIYLE